MVIVGGRSTARVVAGLARQKAWRETVIAGSFGITLGFMNFAIYQSFARIPLGVAVTIEFLGPLAVTVTGALAGGAGRRRVTSLAWAALAAGRSRQPHPGRGRPPQPGRRRVGGGRRRGLGRLHRGEQGRRPTTARRVRPRHRHVRGGGPW